MKKNKKEIKSLEFKEVKDIIKICRSMGVSELRVGNLQISFFPTLVSKYNPSVERSQPLTTQSQKNSLIPNENKNDINSPVDEDLLMIENPTEYMAAAERGDITFGEDFSIGTGEQIS